MKSRFAVLVVTAAVFGLTFSVASASASTVSLECGGKGPHNKDSAGTVLCAAEPGKARVVIGSVRDDAGKPVATKVTATFYSWTPVKGGYFNIEEDSTKTITSNANGAFSLPVKTDTRLNVKFSVADEAKGVGAATAEAQVSRRLDVKLTKLGGGTVKLSVKGAAGKRLKLYILDSSGYEISGLPAKSTRSGTAVFNLGSRRGEFSYYVDAGIYGDLFWEERRATFRL
jgi:hypothetical protein